MNIIHRINANNKPLFKDDIDRLGIKYNYSETIVGKWIFFEISENNPMWPEVCSLIEKHELGSHMVRTEFTAKELKTADNLEMDPTWHHGYPMPDDDFGYKYITYDPMDLCIKCGIDKKQKSPFRMRGEPKWLKRHILQLHWVYDEYFALPEVWEEVFKPFGISCRPVVRHRTGEELKTVVQLNIEKIATSNLNTDQLQYEVCPHCNLLKYLPVTRGYFPTFYSPQKEHIFKTREYFGSGGSAYRAVIVSAQLYREIKKNKLKGVTFTPLENKVYASCHK